MDGLPRARFMFRGQNDAQCLTRRFAGQQDVRAQRFDDAHREGEARIRADRRQILGAQAQQDLARRDRTRQFQTAQAHLAGSDDAGQAVQRVLTKFIGGAPTNPPTKVVAGVR